MMFRRNWEKRYELSNSHPTCYGRDISSLIAPISDANPSWPHVRRFIHCFTRGLINVTKQDKTSLYQWVRFIFGVLIFGGVISVHAFVQPFSDIVFVALLAIPGALIGVDVKGIFGGGK